MINIIHNSWLFKNKQANCYGTHQRIEDLLLYMKNNNILCDKDNFLYYKKYYNIISSLPTYEYYFENYPSFINNISSIMICATNIMEPYKKRYDILIKKTNKLLIFHNAYKSHLFRQKEYNSIFLPMFLYQYNLPKVSSNIFKYQYGISLDSSVCTVMFIKYIQQIFPNMLIMSRDQDIKNVFEHTTSDKEYFFNSVENIILLSDKYNCSHVGSRFVFECMYLQKPMYILCPSKEFIYDRTLQQFSSLQYELIDTLDMFTLWEVKNIDPKLVMYETYNTYLQTMLQCIKDKKARTNIKQYQYAEEYIY